MRCPDPNSVFVFLRNKAIFYTVAVGVTVFLGAFRLFGLKRPLTTGK